MYCNEVFNYTLFSSLILDQPQLDTLMNRIEEAKASGALVGDIGVNLTSTGYTQIYSSSAVRFIIDGIDHSLHELIRPVLRENQYARMIYLKSDHNGLTFKRISFCKKGLINSKQDIDQSSELFDLSDRLASSLPENMQGMILPMSGIPFDKGLTKQYLFSTKLKISSAKAYTLCKDIQAMPHSYSGIKAIYSNEDGLVYFSGQSNTFDDFSTVIINRSQHLYRISEIIYQNCSKDQDGAVYMVSIAPSQTLISIQHVMI